MTVSPEESPWEEVQAGPEFTELRRRLRRFVFPMTAAFLVWYLVFVLLADYAPEFMSQRVAGNITLGLVLGLGQFASTFLITFLYVRHADRRIDPLADRIRHDLESR